MSLITFDESSSFRNLYPFTETRSPLDIRVGILTIREKWENLLGGKTVKEDNKSPSLKIPANLVPSREIADAILFGQFNESDLRAQSKRMIDFPWQIFQLSEACIREDYELITVHRISSPIPEQVQVVRSTRIFIEEEARLHHCILNAENGPIYIGRNAVIMEGSVIRGPVAIGEGSVVKMGTKIYGGTSIGPYCMVGGEIKNAVMFGYSNKAHDGYLGDAVIGEWCNLGAGTSNSNLSNTGGNVKVWNPVQNGFVEAGLKCGLLMGDYSRSAINTSFNTGTVVGVCCNVFGEGLTPKYIPNFTWGHKEQYVFENAIRHLANWKKLKNHSLEESEIQRLKIIFERS